MTKIEEVARAIAIAHHSDDGDWVAWMGEARAAIKAMHEPSPAMVDSGVAFALNVSLTNTYRWTDYVTHKHMAMIDAALAEDKDAA